MSKPIPVSSFVALEKTARQAAENGDWETFAVINRRFADINAELIWRDGQLYLGILAKPQEEKPCANCNGTGDDEDLGFCPFCDAKDRQ